LNKFLKNSIILIEGDFMTWIWLGIIIVLILLELATVNLVTIWYIASAIISLILSLFVKNFFIQFLVFVLLGTILLMTTRDVLLKVIRQKKEKTNLDRVVGMQAIVTEEISKNKPGEVKVDGKKWTATSNKKIKVDSVVKVCEIDGVKLKVEEV
jgi:membrane protein implicated in regulation of membrane protease activity